jgi:mRNA-degrading endonuclease toxin of MazEF toxin-antitoxin module
VKCRKAIVLLDDYVDGLLREPDATAVAEHIAACGDCRRSEAVLRRIVQEARDLPREMASPDELWNDIAEGIAQSREETAAVPARRSLVPILAAFAAAALVLAAVSTGFGVWMTRQTPTEVSEGANAPRGYEQALQECATARATLLADLEERKGALSPETVTTVNESLEVIDVAISEIRNALEADPRDERLRRMLVLTYEEEVGLLARIVRLADWV